MRPVGALLIGSYSDRFGRRSAMALTLFLMGLGCAMMALAPTYKQIGIMAPLIIMLARLIQGFAAGGEVGAATTLLVEHAPPAQRGFYASWQFGSQSLGIFSAPSWSPRWLLARPTGDERLGMASAVFHRHAHRTGRVVYPPPS